MDLDASSPFAGPTRYDGRSLMRRTAHPRRRTGCPAGRIRGLRRHDRTAIRAAIAPRLPPPGRRRVRLDRRWLAARAGRRAAPPSGPTSPLAPRPPHFPAEGPAGHLPVHARRPEPPRDVRPQARPPAPRRQAAARQLRPGRDPPQGRRATRCWPRSGPSASTARAGSRSPTSCPTSARVRRRPGGDPLVLGRQRQPPAGRLPDEHRLDPDGQAEPRELGRLRPGDREPGPARVRRPARPRRAGSRAARPPTARGSCRRATRGRVDPRRRRARSSTSSPPDGSTSPTDQRRVARPDRPAQRPPPRGARRRRRARRPGSRPTSWPTGCRCGRPRRSTSSSESAETQPLYGLDDRAHGRVRHPLPAGPPAGRAGRPVRPALLGRRQRLGRPRRRRDEPRARCARGPTSRSPAC